ncbi:ATPase associated with various cellular activities AAA 5 protein, partial [Haloplasma contractile SSD-17B]
MILDRFIFILNNINIDKKSANEIFEIIWRILSTKEAIFIYIFVIFIMIIMIIMIMIYNEVKFQSLIANKNYQKYTKMPKGTKKNKKDKKSKENRKRIKIKEEKIEEESNVEEKTNTSRFFMLKEIDKKREELANIKFNDDITLKQMCEDFRNYAAQKLGLNYDIKDIRRFVCSLAVTKILILQGMSGTGKTSLAYAFGEFVDNPTVIVPVQPMWKERTDLIGYYNEFTQKF